MCLIMCFVFCSTHYNTLQQSVPVLFCKNSVELIMEHLAAMGMCFLGRDRAFRSYFFLHTFGLLLIENPDQCTVGYCDQVSPVFISQPTNVVVKVRFWCFLDASVYLECIYKKYLEYSTLLIKIKKLSSPCESKNVLDYENERIRRYCCTGNPDTCPVHKTKSDSHRFFYYVERDGVENVSLIRYDFDRYKYLL